MMALPPYVTRLGNIKGPKGDKGDPGTFESITTATVPYGQPTQAEISGDRGEHAYIETMQGPPGVNAVPADEAVGAYVGTPGSHSRSAVAAAVNAEGAVAFGDVDSDLTQAAAGLFPVYRLWDTVAEAYPDRVEGAFNTFVGPVHPGLLMDPDVDVWEIGDGTTLAAVAAAMLDTSSPVYAAAQWAGNANRIPLVLNPESSSSLQRASIGSSPNRLFGWRLPKGASALFGATSVPAQWTNVRVRVIWAHTTVGGSGNARLFCDITPYDTSSAPSTGVHLETSASVAAVNVPRENIFSGSNPVTPGGGVAVVFGRLASGADTFPDGIVIVNAFLERQA